MEKGIPPSLAKARATSLSQGRLGEDEDFRQIFYMSVRKLRLSFLYRRAVPWCRRYKQHRFNKTTFFLSIFKQYFSGKIEGKIKDSGGSRVVEGADPYRLWHVRIDALEANDSSSTADAVPLLPQEKAW